MVRWHHRLNEHEFEQTPGDIEEQRSLRCYSAWGRRELDMTEQLNNIIVIIRSSSQCVSAAAMC